MKRDGKLKSGESWCDKIGETGEPREKFQAKKQFIDEYSEIILIGHCSVSHHHDIRVFCPRAGLSLQIQEPSCSSVKAGLPLQTQEAR